MLVGVQAVNISRLSTHPLPMISQGLVTVAGQGPKDSNGAGKSSLIAALRLLHADEQWRPAGGAAGAAGLAGWPSGGHRVICPNAAPEYAS
ncbi:hypothetical protein GCM10029978_063060 [Actinoallomurus acanthiterrae]